MLEAFLDRVPDTNKEKVRLLVHGMRLFALSAQKDLSPKVDLPILAARKALRALQVERLESSLGMILQSLLQASSEDRTGSCSGQPFGAWPESSWMELFNEPANDLEESGVMDLDGAWDCLRESLPPGSKLPTPGVPRIEVARALLNMAPKMHLGQEWILFWKARLVWVVQGPGKAELAFAGWCKRFEPGADSVMGQCVAKHRAALSLGEGKLDKARVVLRGAGIPEPSFKMPEIRLVVDRLVAHGDLGAGPDSRSAVLEFSTPRGLPLRSNEAWQWDGLWGSSGCWVGCFSANGEKRWLRDPVGVPGGVAKPDELETRAMARLGLEVEVASGQLDVVAGARLKGTKLRVSVCVWEGRTGVEKGAPCPGRVLGWVTWEWSHWVIPDSSELIAMARNLVLSPHNGSLIEGDGRARTSSSTESAGLALISWFQGLGKRHRSLSPLALWHPFGPDWVKVYTATQMGGAGEGQSSNPNMEDLKRCVQLGTSAVYWNRDPRIAVELVPVLGGEGVVAIVESETIDVAEFPLSSVLNAEDFVAWSLAGVLDRAGSGGELAACLPLGDSSFVSFLGRLSTARDKSQHIALAAHAQGFGGVLKKWLEGCHESGSGQMWLSEWIRWECDDSKELRTALESWERAGEPFQVFQLPSLSRRRHELVGWVQRMSESRGFDIGWEDGALAAIWRQPWLGQEKQLASVVFHLAQTGSGPVTRAHVESALVERGIEVVPRLDSKRPWPGDIASAISVTRSESGRMNKTRASIYLGWDPDTLVARMRDLDWLEGVVPDPDPWASS